jgi:hypothetical protein
VIEVDRPMLPLRGSLRRVRQWRGGPPRGLGFAHPAATRRRLGSVAWLMGRGRRPAFPDVDRSSRDGRAALGTRAGRWDVLSVSAAFAAVVHSAQEVVHSAAILQFVAAAQSLPRCRACVKGVPYSPSVLPETFRRVARRKRPDFVARAGSWRERWPLLARDPLCLLSKPQPFAPKVVIAHPESWVARLVRSSPGQGRLFAIPMRS